MERLFIIGFLLVSFNTFSQYVAKKHIKDYDTDYVYVRGSLSGLNGFKWVAQADLGQITGDIKNRDSNRFVMDKEGEIIEFTSPANIINVFTESGYEYVSSQNTDQAFLILFRKKK